VNPEEPFEVRLAGFTRPGDDRPGRMEPAPPAGLIFAGLFLFLLGLKSIVTYAGIEKRLHGMETLIR